MLSRINKKLKKHFYDILEKQTKSNILNDSSKGISQIIFIEYLFLSEK
jgi:hypothetical protein